MMEDDRSDVMTLPLPAPEVPENDNPLSTPTVLDPSLSQRIKAAALSFVLSPIALFLMLSSVASMLEWAAVGQPLSSSEGVAGLLASALIFMILGSLATRTSVGQLVTALWALAFTLLGMFVRAPLGANPESFVAHLDLRLPRGIVFDLTTTTSWSALSGLVLIVCVGAFIATRVSRHNRRLEEFPVPAAPKRWWSAWTQTLDTEALHGDATWFATPGSSLPVGRARLHLAILVLDVIMAIVAWILLVSVAPSDVTLVARYGSLGLGMYEPHVPAILGLLACLLILTVSAGWSLFGPLIAGGALMILPGMILFPVVTSLSGAVATPTAPFATSLAITGPVIAALGLLTISLTWGIHWVRTAPIVQD